MTITYDGDSGLWRGASPLRWFEVKGFKSHRAGSRIDVRGLTVLAGANSSGKSSVMQPLLLLKQSLHEDRYDPGPLKLDGPNVVFNDPSQFLTTARLRSRSSVMETRLGFNGFDLDLKYEGRKNEFSLAHTEVKYGQSRHVVLVEGQEIDEEDGGRLTGVVYSGAMHFTAARTGVAHGLRLSRPGQRHGLVSGSPGAVGAHAIWPVINLSFELMRMIHLGGHRGNPSRRYPRSVSSRELSPGLFHEQAAGVVAHWSQHAPASLERLQLAMRAVGLGWSIAPVDLDATAIDLRIGRTRETSRGPRDLVSIADVGFGVSQSLPVLVALIDAKPGQLVYIEQPEIHLHPRAQIGVADLIVEASKRGARVVIETHSEIILTRIQYHVAKGTLPAADVLVHWFVCDPKTGDSSVTAVEPDASGAFGDWPVDFAEVGEQVDREYVEAAWKRQSGEKK